MQPFFHKIVNSDFWKLTVIIHLAKTCITPCPQSNDWYGGSLEVPVLVLYFTAIVPSISSFVIRYLFVEMCRLWDVITCMLTGATTLFVIQRIIEILCCMYLIFALVNLTKCAHKVRNNLLNIDPAYESLSISDTDDTITSICTQ